MEIGPQPHGVVRSAIFSAMQEGVQLMLDWICQFNSGMFSTITNPCRNLFAVCISMACMRLCVQGRCLKEDRLMCTQWWRISTIHETPKHTQSRLRFIPTYRYRNMTLGLWGNSPADTSMFSERAIAEKTSSLFSFSSRRIEISVFFIPETQCSCLSQGKRCATKEKKHSIHSL